MKKHIVVMLSLFLFFAALFSGAGDCTAGTYIYKDENGDKVLFIPKDTKDTRSTGQRSADKNKGVPVGTPFKHKKKTEGQDIRK